MPPRGSEDSRRFDEQVQPHDAMLRAWLHSRFPGESDIDDVVQEAYVRLLRARERFEVASPKAFLFAVARNLAMDRLPPSGGQDGTFSRNGGLVRLGGGRVDSRNHRPQPGARNFDRSHPESP
ncbi:MAG: RNA polymerase sigma factor [Opitutaceae bacterium]